MRVDYNYSTGDISNVVNELRAAIGQYARQYNHIKVGITGDPTTRSKKYDYEFAQQNDSWSHMVVIYETSSEKYVREAEINLQQWLENHKYEEPLTKWNIKKGGGPLPETGPYFVYVVLD